MDVLRNRGFPCVDVEPQLKERMGSLVTTAPLGPVMLTEML